MLEEVRVNPIPIGWYDKNPQVNASSITRLSPTLIPASCQPSKHLNVLRNCLVTRKDDFLCGI